LVEGGRKQLVESLATSNLNRFGIITEVIGGLQEEN
jgi:hypothetical protein